MPALLPGFIPNKDLISETFPDIYFQTNWSDTIEIPRGYVTLCGQQIVTFYGGTLTWHRERIFPSFSLPASAQGICRHSDLDDLYHWWTDYRFLPPCPSDEDIRIRLNHPDIVWSATTYILVNRWAAGQETRKVFKFLHQSPLKWSYVFGYGFVLVRKWKTFIKNNTESISIPRFSKTRLAEIIHERNRPPFLLPYNEKATNHFNFKQGLNPVYRTFLGVELELENLTSKNETILTKTLKNHCIFKRDGSVKEGVEICSAPATLDVHKTEFASFFENTEKTLQVKANCGLHVHVNRQGLGKVQLAKIIMFMNNPDNNIQIEHLAGRVANNYCRRQQYIWRADLPETESSRYSRINTSPSQTIEFRLFAATLSFTIFLSNLEFVQAIVDYTATGEHAISIKDILKWENFINYIKNKKHFYPNLCKQQGVL